MDEEIGIDDAVNNAMSALEKDGLIPKEEDEGVTQDTTEQNEAEKPIVEGEEKPSEAEKIEAEKPIEAPASLRSDEREMFKAMPTEAQTMFGRLEQSRQSYFTQRTTQLAQEQRAAADERQQHQTERARYVDGLNRLEEMASQLLPAKFQDIKSQADYLRLKATDPDRASQYEAFQMTMQMSAQEKAKLQSAKHAEHLNREAQALVEKHPEYRDEAKFKAALNDVRKTAVEYYGFNPKEVEVVGDHRYVDVILDAKAWRDHQANLRAAGLKKTAPTTQKVLRQTATTGTASLADDKKAALLKRAKAATNDREKAEYLARLLG